MTNGYDGILRVKALRAPKGKTLRVRAWHRLTPQGLAIEWHIRCLAGTQLVLTNGIPWPKGEKPPA